MFRAPSKKKGLPVAKSTEKLIDRVVKFLLRYYSNNYSSQNCLIGEIKITRRYACPGLFLISYSARPRRIILLLICLTADSKIWENELTTVMFVKTSRVCVPCALNRLVANKNLFTQPKRRRHWTPSGNVPLRSRPFISRAHPKPQSTYFLAF